ncbi:amylo-alpha-1,6-glucosidase [Oscillochloris sp. ZM17-4]|uniref:MGH1-like glycoside hydrolase domain-containing protein n=1 Tax=Oscillochloris sp. ZM17-4 TaxID=2866714 RepID=UPI001C734F4C|nr:amylo-alpha-1,6-glucosidase [Oscillochloris sp. ZM17-4]MBX0331538.1 amylo-alpha-1,6-glucosidase [Oscillochloris sp. ZM17-4]
MRLRSRQLVFAGRRLESGDADPGAAPYVIGGPSMYAIGYGSAELAPIGAEHLVGAMGGVWAHPLRLADGLAVDLLGPDGAPLPAEGADLREDLASVAWGWRAAGLRVERHDSVRPDARAYDLLLTLTNQADLPASGALRLSAHLQFLGAWFGGIASDGGTFRQQDALVVGQDGIQRGWGLALGCAAAPPDSCAITPQDRGALVDLRYRFQLAPGETRSWPLLLVADPMGGGQAAATRWQALNELSSGRGKSSPGMAGQAAPAAQGAASRPLSPDSPLPSLACATGDLALHFSLAQANLSLLRADYPDLGGYFLAGLPEYPQLFGCDTAYSVAGASAGGFAATARSSLVTLAGYAARACGRVPHEITTNGRVFHPGNIQETPQLTIAAWDYLRWSGDLALAGELFPTLREGVRDLLPTACGQGRPYPYGDGMVERMGMGSRKLDSACYAIAGLRALAQIAAALGHADAPAYAARAEAIRAAFEQDWWVEAEGLYGDSMHSDGALQLDGHWTAVLPVQLGIAAPERARRSLARIDGEFVNAWGLVHTRGREELVWTLPTGLLALARFAHGRAAEGLRLAENIALTARSGALGTFKELIPQGLCFIQLWSAGLYLQAIIEGLLGVSPDAPSHRLALAPCVPADLAPVTLRDLRVGGHLIDITASARGVSLHHRAGPQPLSLTYAGATQIIAVGARFERE